MIRRLLRDERGFSLVFTLLTMVATTVTLTTVIQYTSSNSKAANRSEADQIAYALAEAGLANGAAVLSNPNNDALDQSTLPGSEPDAADPADADYVAAYEGGTVKWWGVLTGHQWLMHGVGIVNDPAGGGAPVRREATSTIKIQPTLKQNLNNNAWNFMLAKGTGDPSGCDVTMENAVSVDTSLFILGNLCFANSAAVTKAAAPDLTSLYVQGRVYFGGTGSIGLSTAKISSATIVNGCKVGGGATGGTWTSPCTSSTRVHADTISNAPIVNDGGPTANFDFWYQNAKPGPTQACTTSSGTPPAFESAGSTTRNNSAATFNLTPSSSYTCQYWDHLLSPPALLGELSWNNTTKTLTASGVIYIDGSAYISNNTVNKYDGLATLYLSGTFTIDGNAQLCGGVAGGNCDFASWNPNEDNFGIITDGQDANGYGVKLQNQARYQGSIYATNDVLLESNTAYDGPIVANSFKLENNIATHEFPTITSVPVGWPGNPTVYAEPQPPSNYSG